MGYSPPRFSRKLVKTGETVRIADDDQMRVSGLVVDGNLIVDGDLVDDTPTPLNRVHDVVVTNADSPYDAVINETVKVDPSGGAVTVRLPPSGPHTGLTIRVKNVTSDTTPITVISIVAETIDGAASLVLSTGFDGVTVESDGSNWLVVL